MTLGIHRPAVRLGRSQRMLVFRASGACDQGVDFEAAGEKRNWLAIKLQSRGLKPFTCPILICQLDLPFLSDTGRGTPLVKLALRVPPPSAFSPTNSCPVPSPSIISHRTVTRHNAFHKPVVPSTLPPTPPPRPKTNHEATQTGRHSRPLGPRRPRIHALRSHGLVRPQTRPRAPRRQRSAHDVGRTLPASRSNPLRAGCWGRRTRTGKQTDTRIWTQTGPGAVLSGGVPAQGYGLVA